MRLTAIALAVLLIPALARAADRTNTPAAPIDPTLTGVPTTESQIEKMSDARIAATLHHVNQMEIDAGNLAQAQCQTARCKEFGRILVAEHQKADTQLIDIARRASFDLDALTAKDRAKLQIDDNKMDQVKRMHGALFDKTFGQVMANGHGNVLDMLRDHKGDIRSGELKRFVENTIPVLENHKDLAAKIDTKIQARSPRR